MIETKTENSIPEFSDKEIIDMTRTVQEVYGPDDPGTLALKSLFRDRRSLRRKVRELTGEIEADRRVGVT